MYLRSHYLNEEKATLRFNNKTGKKSRREQQLCVSFKTKFWIAVDNTDGAI